MNAMGCHFPSSRIWERTAPVAYPELSASTRYARGVREDQDWCGAYRIFQTFERVYLFGCPSPCCVLLQQSIHWLCNVREVADEAAVEGHESEERADLCGVLGCLPVLDVLKLHPIHHDPVVGDLQT